MYTRYNNNINDFNIGDLLLEKSSEGLSFGHLQRVIEDERKETMFVLGTPENPNLIWTTYMWTIKFNFKFLSTEKAEQQFPEKLI